MSAATPTPAPFNAVASLLQGPLLENPYPIYAGLRASQPVFQVPVPFDVGAGVFVLTRYADVQQVLRDPRLSVDRRRSDALSRNIDRLPAQLFGEESLFRSMLMMDAPDHTRVRGLVNKAFTPRRVAELRPHVEAIAKALLAGPAAAGRLDVIAELGAPLPAIVIAELLGVPAEDHAKFRTWAAQIVATPLTLATGAESLRQGFESLNEYLRGVIAARRKAPQNDLISALVAAQDEREALSDGELLATAVLLLVAGHETTTNLIGNGTLALLQHPAELARVRAEPELLKSAIEEMLRFDSPVQGTVRVALEDVEIGGARFAKGALLIAAIGAANRDPAAFPEPDRFDVERRDNHHLSFGFGAHFCLGAPLARMEGEVAFRALFEAFPKPALSGAPIAHRPNPILRGLQALEVVSASPS
ncbi:MAG TPA: cytochrome P450 [Myxococcota bacterium]|nr:cytochrome P450 [Myxococcota bacterium]